MVALRNKFTGLYLKKGRYTYDYASDKTKADLAYTDNINLAKRFTRGGLANSLYNKAFLAKNTVHYPGNIASFTSYQVYWGFDKSFFEIVELGENNEKNDNVQS